MAKLGNSLTRLSTSAYGRFMAYQPKGGDAMSDFEILSLVIAIIMLVLVSKKDNEEKK